MPEPFKNVFNPEMISQMGAHFRRVDRSFKADLFVKQAATGLSALEMKARSNQIRDALADALPENFERSCEILLASLHPQDSIESGNQMDDQGIAGWAIDPMADFVAVHGQGHFDLSLSVLKEMTKRFTAEFAVRPFFVADPERALGFFQEWASDPNFHVRRLVSEGSRPRLPWGLRLHSFVNDPQPLLPLLNSLKDDQEEYVRRSVANNLNDISKDHPDLVADIAKDWLKGASKDRKRLVKHACRSLIKGGHPGALEALGYGEPLLEASDIILKNAEITLGGSLDFEVEISSLSEAPQPLMIDYVIHHLKANGETSPKVFKLKIAEIKPGARMVLQKKHPIKPITTRVYYEGPHGIELQINGKSFGQAAFLLKL